MFLRLLSLMQLFPCVYYSVERYLFFCKFNTQHSIWKFPITLFHFTRVETFSFKFTYVFIIKKYVSHHCWFLLSIPYFW